MPGSLKVMCINLVIHETAGQAENQRSSVVCHIASVAAGSQFSLFVDHDGNVWEMGYSHYGELGYHALLLDENGEVWTCGYNWHGQLGRPAEIGQRSANVENVITSEIQGSFSRKLPFYVSGC